MDDLLFIGNNQNWTNLFKQQLIFKFDLLELSKRDMTLYLKVECIKLFGGIFMTQCSYALQVLKYFGIKNYTTTITTMKKQLKLIIDINIKLCNLKYYYSMVKKLNHHTHICFDISIAIGIY